jgi:hypothetical protein
MDKNYFSYCYCFLTLLLLALLSGCAGIAEGVAQAVMKGKGVPKRDTRQCHVLGRPFDGLDTFLSGAANCDPETIAKTPDLKVLMVHGIGIHHPGYSARLTENLALALSLNKKNEQYKELRLSRPHYPEQEVGVLRISRHFSEN